MTFNWYGSEETVDVLTKLSSDHKKSCHPVADEWNSCIRKENIKLHNTAVLTLSSTLRHLSAPHKDATRFSLSSSSFRLCTHSLTVTTHTREKLPFPHQESDVKVTSCNVHLGKQVHPRIHTNVVTCCVSYTHLCLQYGPNLPAAAALLWTNPQLSWRLARAASPWQGGPSATNKMENKPSWQTLSKFAWSPVFWHGTFLSRGNSVCLPRGNK